MLKDKQNSRKSLSRCIYMGSWIVVLVGAFNYLFNGGPDIAAMAGSILTPAGLAYAARAHTESLEANDGTK